MIIWVTCNFPIGIYRCFLHLNAFIALPSHNLSWLWSCFDITWKYWEINYNNLVLDSWKRVQAGFHVTGGYQHRCTTLKLELSSQHSKLNFTRTKQFWSLSKKDSNKLRIYYWRVMGVEETIMGAQKYTWTVFQESKTNYVLIEIYTGLV